MIINKDKVDLIFRLANEGKSVVFISDLLNITTQTAYNLIRYGVKTYGYVTPPNLTIKLG